jgi:hypothetical protein
MALAESYEGEVKEGDILFVPCLGPHVFESKGASLGIRFMHQDKHSITCGHNLIKAKSPAVNEGNVNHLSRMDSVLFENAAAAVGVVVDVDDDGGGGGDGGDRRSSHNEEEGEKEDVQVQDGDGSKMSGANKKKEKFDYHYMTMQDLSNELDEINSNKEMYLNRVDGVRVEKSTFTPQTQKPKPMPKKNMNIPPEQRHHVNKSPPPPPPLRTKRQHRPEIEEL